MTSKEIRELSPAEITTKIRETREGLLIDRLKKETGQLEKPHTIRARRKEIARMETILNEKKRKTAAA